MAHSESPFQVIEHVVPGQHIREYARATATIDGPLDLVVKQYIPLDNPRPQWGDLTIIAAHGSGLPKELYEPLLEEIHQRSKTAGFQIRSVWFADAAHQGASGMLNEPNLGNDPSWFDHARDVIAMVNHFRNDMVRPIVGLGHSMGAGQLILTSLMHPRLFTSLILLEPVFDKSIHTCRGPALTRASTFRRDVWSSREEAACAARKAYKRWDPRVMERWLNFGYRTMPSVVHPNTRGLQQRLEQIGEQSSACFDINQWLEQRSTGSDELRPSDGGKNWSTSDLEPVTLATTKHQEVFSYLRPNFKGIRVVSETSPETLVPAGRTTIPEIEATKLDGLDRSEIPDLVGPPDATVPFYRAEPVIAYLALPHIRPSVFYVFGEKSPLSAPELRRSKLERTGTGVGGSGGAKAGRVADVEIARGTHFVPLERVAECAAAVFGWLGGESSRWKIDEERLVAAWEAKSAREKATVTPEWVDKIKSLL
ncbi:alpha/beta-hydrolase [Aulographum hederae CBS 113979]|uniref:Alpha/beta-hydrolase n=1 Tax=Aulographum hederae CBS 113979 TaxID=1176131 RepID=A0A6G1GTR4_9PEZI|nr:alpha/beta-hydrolase [Aulographum hederae CBS 113979]